ncbi:hypothetical protein Bca52824_086490 [Brassica carinata]|uniref:Gfo/Idh/MocA-like oxidoreductase C-terminal domain-containing protein n=1 Tax=Brassica carinata TaxID=52824 RepID=A0A8X7P9M8_BRACI|nr:hypothetical protein Bca52824_086490 [Brassica carinata]
MAPNADHPTGMRLYNLSVESKMADMATVYGEGGTSRTIFYPFSGVTEELIAFFSDISETSKEQEPRRLSCVEGTRDVAVLGAMLESGARNGAVVPVAKF